MKILGIETSCDETAGAIVQDGTIILSSVVASSSMMYRKYGGIVPEVAAREQLKAITPVLGETFAQAQIKPDEIDAIAVTYGPGLIGSLLVGVETAKTLAFALNKPIIPINHVIAHMYANFVSSQSTVNSSQLKTTQNNLPPSANFELRTSNYEPIVFPAISLVVSGGHTELFLMSDTKTIQWLGGTIDDAAGEAFDKSARLLGFESLGGPAIQKAASNYYLSKESNSQNSSSTNIQLPRPIIHDETLNFSFSGLKTAILREWQKHNLKPQLTTHNLQLVSAFAYEIQEAITDVLVKKTILAAKIHQAKSILVSGGVAANKRLAEKFNSQLTTHNLQFFIPPIELCTDNAAAIAACAFYQNNPLPWQEVSAQPNLSVEV